MLESETSIDVLPSKNQVLCEYSELGVTSYFVTKLRNILLLK